MVILFVYGGDLGGCGSGAWAQGGAARVTRRLVWVARAARRRGPSARRAAANGACPSPHAPRQGLGGAHLLRFLRRVARREGWGKRLGRAQQSSASAAAGTAGEAALRPPLLHRPPPLHPPFPPHRPTHRRHQLRVERGLPVRRGKGRGGRGDWSPARQPQGCARMWGYGRPAPALPGARTAPPCCRPPAPTASANTQILRRPQSQMAGRRCSLQWRYTRAARSSTCRGGVGPRGGCVSAPSPSRLPHAACRAATSQPSPQP
jgi:hypothetical protein